MFANYSFVYWIIVKSIAKVRWNELRYFYRNYSSKNSMLCPLQITDMYLHYCSDWISLSLISLLFYFCFIILLVFFFSLQTTLGTLTSKLWYNHITNRLIRKFHFIILISFSVFISFTSRSIYRFSLPFSISCYYTLMTPINKYLIYRQTSSAICIHPKYTHSHAHTHPDTHSVFHVLQSL